MAHLGVRHIDFWSLDVEGAELSVLQTFDFQQVLPAAWIRRLETAPLSCVMDEFSFLVWWHSEAF